MAKQRKVPSMDIEKDSEGGCEKMENAGPCLIFALSYTPNGFASKRHNLLILFENLSCRCKRDVSLHFVAHSIIVTCTLQCPSIVLKTGRLTGDLFGHYCAYWVGMQSLILIQGCRRYL